MNSLWFSWTSGWVYQNRQTTFPNNITQEKPRCLLQNHSAYLLLINLGQCHKSWDRLFENGSEIQAGKWMSILSILFRRSKCRFLALFESCWTSRVRISTTTKNMDKHATSLYNYNSEFNGNTLSCRSKYEIRRLGFNLHSVLDFSRPEIVHIFSLPGFNVFEIWQKFFEISLKN